MTRLQERQEPFQLRQGEAPYDMFSDTPEKGQFAQSEPPLLTEMLRWHHRSLNHCVHNSLRRKSPNAVSELRNSRRPPPPLARNATRLRAAVFTTAAGNCDLPTRFGHALLVREI